MDIGKHSFIAPKYLGITLRPLIYAFLKNNVPTYTYPIHCLPLNNNDCYACGVCVYVNHTPHFRREISIEKI